MKTLKIIGVIILIIVIHSQCRSQNDTDIVITPQSFNNAANRSDEINKSIQE